MIYVQHLLGIGHLRRCMQLATALADRNFGVDLVSGGMPCAVETAAGVHLHQLPAVYCPDAKFAVLLDADGNEIDESFRKSRSHRLLELFDSLSPQVLITETYPFGRRMMRFELMPLLKKASATRSCRLVVSSIRDILQPKNKPGRNCEIRDLIDKYYDHVLVHGDPSIATLELSFKRAREITSKLYYSGYIGRNFPTPASGGKGRDEVLVSAGGSATGLEILKSAIAARPLTSLAHVRWRILVSPAIENPEFAELRKLAGRSIVVERNRSDFSALMGNARLSISQAGYNTVTDILGAETPAVVIPFTDEGEVEQQLRARRLQQLGRLVKLDRNRLNAQNLAAAVDEALELDSHLAVDLDGASNSAEKLLQWLRAPGV